MSIKRFSLAFFSTGLGLLALVLLVRLANASSQIDIVGPPGSGQFGTEVIMLSNGNFVVTDPYYDAGDITDAGAVYLYDGESAVLLSRLTGSQAGDRISSGGVWALPNGNFLVYSPSWDNSAVFDAGAITWVDGTTGSNGPIGPANSLVGSNTGEVHLVRNTDITILANSNYVISFLQWDNGSGAVDAGAVTWGDGMAGVAGVVSPANSLVGSTTGDQVGFYVTALTNGNYVVSSYDWDGGDKWDAGAVTWGDGTTGITGTVSADNSLVGSTIYDSVGSVTALVNGNYVITSPSWDNGDLADAGAATWGNGTTGITGTISLANSLVGSTSGDQIRSNFGVAALANGNYVVISPFWDNTSVIEICSSDPGISSVAVDAGAATWGDGTTGITGTISAANSLVGCTNDDRVGAYLGVTALTNGNYVVGSPYWHDSEGLETGATTWGDGTTGIAGALSPANSLVGTTFSYVWPYASPTVTALANGNYVVISPNWNYGWPSSYNVGAATWGNGTTGITGTVKESNSLIGAGAVTALTNGNYVVSNPESATFGDGTRGVTGIVDESISLVGLASGSGNVQVTPLAKGNYVVSSPSWYNGELQYAGVVTWGDGTTGITGTVSAANSLVGGNSDDWIGMEVNALANGDYVVSSMFWDDGATLDAGAVTWGNGRTGVSGMVSPANSLVGTKTSDHVGAVWSLADGNYVAVSYLWDNAAIADAGAVTWGDGYAGTTIGPITAANSVRGETADNSFSIIYAYDEHNHLLVVGRPMENIVSLFHPDLPSWVYLPVISNP